MPEPARACRPIRLLLAALACAMVCLMAPLASAAGGPFASADEAWSQGELEKAQKIYEQALAAGGLGPKEVVIAYSRIGTVKAALKDSKGALSAFRTAATIDPAFKLPADSGPVAKKLYAQAHAEAAAQGEKLSVAISAPDNTPAKQPFTLEVSIPSGFAVLVAEVVVTIEDPVTHKKWEKKKPAEPSLSFEFPKAAAVPGARLKVTARAVDGEKNAWALAETAIKVDGTRSVTSMDDGEVSPFEDDKPKKKEDKGGGFFAGPFPWIIGGALLVGGAVVFAVTRPSGDVTVGAPSWQ